jgi:hypothetical protein
MTRITACLTFIILTLVTLDSAGQAKGDKEALWSSFSQLLAEIRTRIPTAVLTDTIPDLSQIKTGTVLLIEPKCRVEDQRQLRRFVERGGRLALIAERPSANACFSAFGLQLDPPHVQNGHRSSKAVILPVAMKTGFPLSVQNVGTVLANRPRTLMEKDGFEPAMTLADGSAVGYLLQVGEGQFMAVSDSSLFINLMLASPANHRLSVRLVNWLKVRPGSLIVGQKDAYFATVSSHAEIDKRAIPAPRKRPSRVEFIALFFACTLAGISLVVLVLSRLAEASTTKSHRATVIARPTLFASSRAEDNRNLDDKVNG